VADLGPRAHSYASDNESFAAFVDQARRSVARLGHTEAVHRHGSGQGCVPGCVVIRPEAPAEPVDGRVDA
jgi:hypothetical protein